jgi:hypothetical protein
VRDEWLAAIIVALVLYVPLILVIEIAYLSVRKKEKAK